ncbi:MAG: class B sortase [Oscillospiraceae bacterium]|jgi:sortase B|nr:class B sortase [Oscillospiraceae bacterium]
MAGKRLESKEKKPLSARVRIGLIVLCALGMAASLTYIGVYFAGTLAQTRLEDEQKEWLELIPTLPPSPSPSPQTSPQSSSPLPPQATETTEIPSATPPPDYRTRFASILEKNDDFFGVLNIPGTGIADSFVVQGTDNALYLNTSFDGKRNSRGTLFVDSRNSPGFQDDNYTIYGHNMQDGTMFHDIPNYAKEEFYLGAPIITFDTVYGPTEWLVFAAYVCESNFNYFHPRYVGDEFEILLEEIHMRSLYHTGVDVNADDTLLTLSTCNYTFEDARFAVHARLLRPGESTEGFVPTAEKNKNRKSYNVPNQMKFSEMPAELTAPMYYNNLRRNYFFRLGASGIEWYSGGLSTVQGPYTAWSGKINANHYSWLAAGATYDDGTDCYIVSGGLNGDTPGLFVLRALTARGTYRLLSKTPVTPEGVDARWPALHGGTLYYTVLESEGTVTAVYSVPVTGGEPALVCTADASADARPCGVAETPRGSVLLIQDFATGTMRGIYLDGGEAVALNLPAQEGRFTLYTDRAGVLKYFSESAEGFLTGGDFDIACIPDKAQMPVGESAAR